MCGAFSCDCHTVLRLPFFGGLPGGADPPWRLLLTQSLNYGPGKQRRSAGELYKRIEGEHMCTSKLPSGACHAVLQ
jgi:hypothetical protein